MENTHRNEGNPVGGNVADGVSVDGVSFDSVTIEGVTIDGAHSRSVSRGASRVRFVSTESDEIGLLRVAKLRDEFVATSKRIAQEEAARARALAQIQEIVLSQASDPAEIDLTLRSRAAECAAALGVSDRTVLGQMNDAHTLVYAYPATHTALEDATITMQHAKAIVNEGAGVGEALREAYEGRCLQIATETSPGRLRVQARKIAQTLQPRSIDELHQIAAAQRCVWVRELPDGMAELGAILPAVLAYGIRDRIGRIAKAAKLHVARTEAEGRAAGSTGATGATEATEATPTVAEGLGIAIPSRTELPEDFDQLAPEAQAQASDTAVKYRDARERASLDTYRADVFAELLLSGIFADETATPGAGNGQTTATRQVITGIQANISIVIPVGGTATLDGYGPIDAATARQFAAAAPGWDATTTNAAGEVLATDRRQPTEAMKRILRARDQHCRFPGCFVPTASCEIDHTIEWSVGGPTDISNLGHLCKKHHMLKHPDLAHQIRWRVEQDSDGVYYWTSPTGADFTDLPEHTFRASYPSPSATGVPGKQLERDADDEFPF